MTHSATPLPDVDLVTRLLEEVARDIVLPRFRSLREDEIERKPSLGHTDDVVTIADRLAELRLVDELRGIVPAAVLGEEAAHADPTALRLVELDAPLWIVDPLDGTQNFARGDDGFGIMVAFAVAGAVRAGWIHLPTRGLSYVAMAGDGAYRNRERLRVPDQAPEEYPAGSFMSRFMPSALRSAVQVRSARRFRDSGQSGAAAIEYSDIATGRKDFVVYYRLLPWDHGAPALILTEAGGCVEHLDGDAYTVRSPSQLTVAARTPAVSRRVRGWLTASD